MKSKCRFLIIAASAALVASFARAAEKSYVGASGGDWFTAANWSPEGVPTAADAPTSVIATLFGAASGGGIWLTADAFDFAATAVLSVKGGNTSYTSPGGGGRIAIGEGMPAAYVEVLAETGECPGLRNSARRQNERALASFAARHPGATVVLSGGNDKTGAAVEGNTGSFEFYMPTGAIVIIW